MLVRKPLNIDDEGVVDGMNRVEQPSSQPTAMSYSLQRIRLSEVSRSIVDRTPLIMASTNGLNHDVVMDIDTELQLLMSDIPPFFSMSTADLTEIYKLGPSQASNIAYQGYMLYSLLHSQSCKLHFPFFSRGFANLSYAPSRDICLQSARLVIQTETKLEASAACKGMRYRFIGLLVAVFMASIVLLMDLCHNKSSPQQEKQRLEIADALRILEDARHQSEMAARFLDSMMHVLRKHKLSPPNGAEQETMTPGFGREQSSTASGGAVVRKATREQPLGEAVTVSVPTTSASVLPGHKVCSTVASGNEATSVENLSTYFNDLAESFEQGVDVGSLDWYSIFSGINSSFI